MSYRAPNPVRLITPFNPGIVAEVRNLATDKEFNANDIDSLMVTLGPMRAVLEGIEPRNELTRVIRQLHEAVIECNVGSCGKSSYYGVDLTLCAGRYLKLMKRIAIGEVDATLGATKTFREIARGKRLSRRFGNPDDEFRNFFHNAEKSLGRRWNYLSQELRFSITHAAETGEVESAPNIGEQLTKELIDLKDKIKSADIATSDAATDLVTAEIDLAGAIELTEAIGMKL